MTLMGQIHPDRADTTLTIASWRERLRLALTILRGKPVTFIFPSPIVNIFHEPKETNVTDSDAAADKLEEAMR